MTKKMRVGIFAAIGQLMLVIACQDPNIDTAIAPFSPGANMTPTNSPLPTRSPTSNAPSRRDNATLVDLHTVSPQIRLDLRYATTDNFMGRKLYPVGRCVLRYAVAQNLAQVQTELAKQGLGLKVYDCYRPLSVQRQMWQVLPDDRYVADPAKGSRHNRGAAVDLTLVDREGKELEMPTAFDDFTAKAHRDYTGASQQAQQNRQLLETAMTKFGFIPLPTEWWHFDGADWENYPIQDVPLQSISHRAGGRSHARAN